MLVERTKEGNLKVHTKWKKDRNTDRHNKSSRFKKASDNHLKVGRVFHLCSIIKEYKNRNKIKIKTAISPLPFKTFFYHPTGTE
jgi:hypothetical protein